MYVSASPNVVMMFDTSPRVMRVISFASLAHSVLDAQWFYLAKQRRALLRTSSAIRRTDPIPGDFRLADSSAPSRPSS
jgi:hypothetical protein